MTGPEGTAAYPSRREARAARKAQNPDAAVTDILEVGNLDSKTLLKVAARIRSNNPKPEGSPSQPRYIAWQCLYKIADAFESVGTELRDGKDPL